MNHVQEVFNRGGEGRSEPLKVEDDLRSSSIRKEADGRPPKVGYAFVGYPGSGKSTAGEILADLLRGIIIETGDIVRDGAADHFNCPVDDLSSKELGDYSTMRRDTDGGDYVARDVIEMIENDTTSNIRPTIIIGMRDSESPALFEDYFDVFRIIWVHADFDVRLARMQSRGRQDEGAFTRDDLQERDGRESMWGTSDLTFQADVRIGNNGTFGELENSMHDFAERQFR